MLSPSYSPKIEVEPLRQGYCDGCDGDKAEMVLDVAGNRIALCARCCVVTTNVLTQAFKELVK